MVISISSVYKIDCHAEILQDADYSYEVLEDGTVKIVGYSGSSAELIIPNSIGEYTVSQLGEKSFMGNETLESVTIPSTVKVISNYSFKNCANLKIVRLEEGLQEIGEDAFYETGLTSFSFPSTVTKVGLRAIGRTQITSIHVPNTVTEWGRGVFYGNEKLVTVTFAANITEIPAGMFSACSQLSQIDIPSTVVTIKDSAFSFCGTFERFELPEKLTYMDRHIFYCTKVKHLYAPCKKVTIVQETFSQADIDELTCHRYSTMYDKLGKNFSGKVNLLGQYLNIEKITMNPGGSKQLKVNNAVGTTSWTSSDSSVATVSSKGIVTGINKGTATITAINDGVTMKCTVKVNLLKLSQKKATIWKGKTVKLRLDGGTNVKWKSSNKKIATVNSKGVVTGKKKGKVDIIAKCKGISYICKVTVKEPKIAFENKKNYVTVGFKTKLKLKNAKKINWTSANKQIAIVNSKGVVTGKRAGTTTITAKCNGKSYKCKVIVESNSRKLSNIRLSDYYDGLISIDFVNVTAVGNTYQVKGIIVNKKSQKVSKILQTRVTLKHNGKVLAEQWFKNIYVIAYPGSYGEFTITFDKSSVKKKNVDLRNGSVVCDSERTFVSY